MHLFQSREETANEAKKYIQLQEQFNNEKRQSKKTLDDATALIEVLQSNMEKEGTRTNKEANEAALREQSLQSQLAQRTQEYHDAKKADNEKTEILKEQLSDMEVQYNETRADRNQLGVAVACLSGIHHLVGKTARSYRKRQEETKHLEALLGQLRKDKEVEMTQKNSDLATAREEATRLQKSLDVLQSDYAKQGELLQTESIVISSLNLNITQLNKQLLDSQSREESFKVERETLKSSIQELKNKPSLPVLSRNSSGNIVTMREPLREINPRQLKRPRTEDGSESMDTLEAKYRTTASQSSSSMQRQTLLCKSDWEKMCQSLFDVLMRFRPAISLKVELDVAMGLITQCFLKYDASFRNFEEAIERPIRQTMSGPTSLCLLSICTSKKWSPVSRNVVCANGVTAGLHSCIQVQREGYDSKKVLFFGFFGG